MASLKGWNKSVPRSQRPPMPACLVLVMTRLFIVRSQYQWALITWLGFDGYFRISEIFQLTPSDITFQRDFAAVFLGRSKTGLNQSVVISQPQLICLLRVYMAERGTRSGTLFTVSQPGYRTAWQAILYELKAQEHGFTPHSLRHGGATNDMILEKRTLEQIMQRGRWQQEKTTRNYLQTSRALVLHIAIDETVRNKGTRLQAQPEKIIKGIRQAGASLEQNNLEGHVPV